MGLLYEQSRLDPVCGKQDDSVSASCPHLRSLSADLQLRHDSDWTDSPVGIPPNSSALRQGTACAPRYVIAPCLGSSDTVLRDRMISGRNWTSANGVETLRPSGWSRCPPRRGSAGGGLDKGNAQCGAMSPLIPCGPVGACGTRRDVVLCRTGLPPPLLRSMSSSDAICARLKSPV